MTRDELILSCQPTVNNLVRKYNNHRSDEDLQAVGMTSVIQCVDKCLDEGLTDVDQVQARCNTWARNAILNEIYREKVKYADDNIALELMQAEEDTYETITNIKSVLTPRENEVFDLMLEGFSQEEIMDKLSLKRPSYFKHFLNIKEKIKKSW